MVVETREEFLNLYTPKVENPNGRDGTHTTQGVEGAQAWGELFVPDTPDKQIQAANRILLEEDHFSPGNSVVGSRAIV